MENTIQDFRRRCRYYKPASKEVARDHELVREAISICGGLIAERVGLACRELSLALTKLEEAMMWANAAIARHRGSEGGRTGDGTPPESI